MQRAVELFAEEPRATRLHTRLRWWWCPFPAMEAEVPKSGDVLEVGCGHGLLTLYLGLASPARRVVGVDIDADKIAEAERATGRLQPGEANVSFRAVEPGYLPDGEWDAIVIADVLYLLTDDGQRMLLEAAAKALRPGGALVVKEMGLTPKWKLRWNRAQETLATRVFRVTETSTQGLTFVAPDRMASWLIEDGLDVTHRPVDHGYPWPHHLIVARRPNGSHAGSKRPTDSTNASTSSTSM
jgi:2-polyprenyl-3-methyl-5-hydroxy-6-metoxy-1,4-benzoquinol methylase